VKTKAQDEATSEDVINAETSSNENLSVASSYVIHIKDIDVLVYY
jgi:hypothetical protein